MHYRVCFVFAILTILTAGCHQSASPGLDAPSPRPAGVSRASYSNETGFVDVTSAAGIGFTHSLGEQTPANVIEGTGGGCAFLDYDGDGLMDIYMVSGVPKPPFTKGTPPSFKPKNHLYHNRGDGTFEDVTDRAGVGLGDRYCIGVAVGDFDNDGRPDIFVACYNGPNVLFHNNGDGTFTDVAKKAGVADMACSVSGAWFDYDNDGWLDLYVCNYVNYDPNYPYFYQPDAYPGPAAFDGQTGALYHNNHDGTFTNVTQQMGLSRPHGRGMGVVTADYDEDGFQDIYVANDAMEKYLFHNDRGKGFTDVAEKAGVAFNVVGEGTASMMATWGDYDNDGHLDLFVPDNSFKSLFHNDGNGIFSDRAPQTGISAQSGQYVSWGSAWIDYDNTGNLDLFIINGALHHLYGQDPLVLRNDGAGKFEDVSTQCGSFFKRKICGRGACVGDFDNDGKPDILINTLNGPAILLHNQFANTGSWITLKLVGHKSNRDGVGTRVKVSFDGKTRVAERQGGGAYLSSNDPRLHFGLGACKQIDRIDLRWPSGIKQTLKDVAVNQILTVEEPQN